MKNQLARCALDVANIGRLRKNNLHRCSPFSTRNDAVRLSATVIDTLLWPSIFAVGHSPCQTARFLCANLSLKMSEKRKLQHVGSLADRERCVVWMQSDAEASGRKGLYLRVIAQFPDMFRSDDSRVNWNKAKSWWTNKYVACNY